MGLFCLDPVGIFAVDGGYALQALAIWKECPRDDRGFMGFLGEVLDVLEQPTAPGPGPSCPYCQYLTAFHYA